MSVQKLYRPQGAPFGVLTRAGVITSTQYLAMFTTQQELVPAAKTGWANLFVGLMLHKEAGTAYAGANNIVVAYTNVSGLELAEIPVAGFHDSTAVQSRFTWNTTGAILAASAITPTAAAAITLGVLVANPTTGTGSFRWRVWYMLAPMVP